MRKREENLKGRLKTLSSVKEKKLSSIVFWRRYSRSVWNCFVLCCMVVRSQVIGSSDTNLFWWFISLFELWSVWYQHVAFFMNVSMKRLLPAFFDKQEKKSIVSCFFINIHLVCCVFVVSWIGKIDNLFIVHISISFLNWVTWTAWVYWETHFLMYFFFFQEVAQFQEEQSEALFEQIHALEHPLNDREQARLHSRLISRYFWPSDQTRSISLCWRKFLTFVVL